MKCFGSMSGGYCIFNTVNSLTAETTKTAMVGSTVGQCVEPFQENDTHCLAFQMRRLFLFNLFFSGARSVSSRITQSGDLGQVVLFGHFKR